MLRTLSKKRKEKARACVTEILGSLKKMKTGFAHLKKTETLGPETLIILIIYSNRQPLHSLPNARRSSPIGGSALPLLSPQSRSARPQDQAPSLPVPCAGGECREGGEVVLYRWRYAGFCYNSTFQVRRGVSRLANAGNHQYCTSSNVSIGNYRRAVVKQGRSIW
jgi:hypothetical protein